MYRKIFDAPAGVTFLVGENGSGKSTLIEALAVATGLNPEGGSRNAMHSTRTTESPLGEALRKAIFYDQLTNGAAGPGMRPVIADRRVVGGQLVIMAVYCPDELPKLQAIVDKLKTDDTVKG